MEMPNSRMMRSATLAFSIISICLEGLFQRVNDDNKKHDNSNGDDDDDDDDDDDGEDSGDGSANFSDDTDINRDPAAMNFDSLSSSALSAKEGNAQVLIGFISWLFMSIIWYKPLFF